MYFTPRMQHPAFSIKLAVNYIPPILLDSTNRPHPRHQPLSAAWYQQNVNPARACRYSPRFFCNFKERNRED
ncbi:hypothetical protein DCC81_15885 [Chitinophaga parva]|uniref:Uncharacterized protein n=1 Tax=Chitinophaga parva TaxID=2169414 RepID=A0A2T7BHJ1_9BACT|nr:hypothetical protein DCC81_15885 [Chitinophaga parva]